jgi:DNA polymerase-3 subunit chi
MAEIAFYHLTARSVDSALPPLLERSLARGWRAAVQVASATRLQHLDVWLWSWRPESFLPHGGPQDPDPSTQPIYLTCDRDNPNSADVRFFLERSAIAPALTAGAAPRLRAALLFDGNDPDELADARTQWKGLRELGHSLVYFQQGEDGKWVEKAREPQS